MNLSLLFNSLLVAASAAMLALLLGGAIALWGLTLKPGGRIGLLAAGVSVLVLPAFVVLNAWFGLFGNGGVLTGWLPFPLMSLTTTVVILALMFWPVSFLLLQGAWARLTPELLESEPLLRGVALLRWVLWPSAAPAITVALAITGVLALNQFAVPALLQVKVYPAEVWIRFNAGLDPWGALGLSWPLVVAPALLLWLAWRKDVPWPNPTGTLDGRLVRSRLGHAIRLGSLILTAVVLTFSLLLPLAQLSLSKSTWIELPAAWKAGGAAVVQSGLMAAVTALLVVIVGLALARRRLPGLAWLGFLVPGVVLGVGLILVFNRPPFQSFYQSSAIVVFAWSLRYFAPGWAIVRRAIQALDPRWSDVARLEGAGQWDRFRLVVWPQAGRTLMAAWYVVFLLCLWDTETLIMIMPPGGETLALRIFNFLHYGHNAQVNALCLILLLLALSPLVLTTAAKGLYVICRDRLMSRWVGMALVVGSAIAATGCKPPSSNEATLNSSIFASVKVIGARGSGLGQFQKPRSVAVDRHDNLYVVDLTGRVQQFSTEGNFLDLWQMPQTERGKPKGMCRDHEGRIVVLEPHYARVNHFTTDGVLVEQWGTPGTNVGEIGFPRAVVAAPDGRIYVSEYMQVERVQAFSTNRQVEWVVGSQGRDLTEFNRAEGLALDGLDRLYVADSCNHRVQVFDAEGRFLRAYGEPGTGPGEMSYPYDVVVDSEGRQYVCEFGNSRIQVFDAEGRWIETLGGAGSAPGQFSNPWGLTLDSQENLYVADSMNHRVQKLIRRVVKG